MTSSSFGRHRANRFARPCLPRARTALADPSNGPPTAGAQACHRGQAAGHVNGAKAGTGARFRREARDVQAGRAGGWQRPDPWPALNVEAGHIQQHAGADWGGGEAKP